MLLTAPARHRQPGWQGCAVLPSARLTTEDRAAQRGAMAREKAKLIRLTEEELQQWEEGARRLGTTASALVRRAVNAALTQQPLLSPAEREELYQAREAF